jgi:hypothetical protein
MMRGLPSMLSDREKSPPRSSAVGNVRMIVSGSSGRHCS